MTIIRETKSEFYKSVEMSLLGYFKIKSKEEISDKKCSMLEKSFTCSVVIKFGFIRPNFCLLVF